MMRLKQCYRCLSPHLLQSTIYCGYEKQRVRFDMPLVLLD